ncbi:DUF1524 domain-containing protein [Lapillicoccus sp.]|uniref:GmrSD restriction endonuclease domain-containing protein n=1 Tax=Lapillicoccus sp. TaxID=1909287 RepID=UPI003983CB57
MPPPTRRTTVITALVAVVVIGLPMGSWATTRIHQEPAPSRTSASSPPPPTAPLPTAPSPSASGAALAALALLEVKGRAPRTGYTRDAFGQAWLDVDRNGCDTRNDVLRRDLVDLILKAGTNGCLVLRGTLHDPYTGATIAFLRGPTSSTAVQIDHVVALADAWQKGAQQWTPQQRAAFANDPLNLLAVDGPANLRKGDGDAATWLPPATAYRCSYAARQVAVKATHRLWVTAPERDALARLLGSCPGEPLPTAGAFVLGGGSEAAVDPPAASGPTTTSAPPSSAPVPLMPKPASGDDPRFATCRAAKAGGFGPYRQGSDPEYGWYRDADRDGIVCE